MTSFRSVADQEFRESRATMASLSEQIKEKDLQNTELRDSVEKYKTRFTIQGIVTFLLLVMIGVLLATVYRQGH